MGRLASGLDARLIWAADHIDELGRDEACIAVGGDSAGGNLAAVVAQTARENGVPLAAQTLFYPFLDVEMNGATARYPSLEENAGQRWRSPVLIAVSPDRGESS